MGHRSCREVGGNWLRRRRFRSARPPRALSIPVPAKLGLIGNDFPGASGGFVNFSRLGVVPISRRGARRACCTSALEQTDGSCVCSQRALESNDLEQHPIRRDRQLAIVVRTRLLQLYEREQFLPDERGDVASRCGSISSGIALVQREPAFSGIF